MFLWLNLFFSLVRWEKKEDFFFTSLSRSRRRSSCFLNANSDEDFRKKKKTFSPIRTFITHHKPVKDGAYSGAIISFVINPKWDPETWIATFSLFVVKWRMTITTTTTLLYHTQTTQGGSFSRPRFHLNALHTLLSLYKSFYPLIIGGGPLLGWHNEGPSPITHRPPNDGDMNE